MTSMLPPDRLGPIGARLRERAEQALTAGEAALGTPSGAGEAAQPPLGERLREHAQRALDDGDVQELLTDVAWEGGTRLVGEQAERAPGLAVGAVRAVVEHLGDALWD